MEQHFWEIMVVIFGVIVTAMLGMVGWYLAGIRSDIGKYGKRLNQHDEKIDLIAKQLSICKVDCSLKLSECKTDCLRESVSKEEWIRSESISQTQMQSMVALMNQMLGKMSMMEQLPNIIAQTLREVMTQMNKGHNND